MENLDSSNKRKHKLICYLIFVYNNTIYSNPLRVKLGDILNITCPADGTSNVWIQVRRSKTNIKGLVSAMLHAYM
jgi:hypothetical protein